MKAKLIHLFALLFILYSIVFIQATVHMGNLSHEIINYYGAGGQILGWTNTSITLEDSDALFKDSFGNSVELLDLIKTSSGIAYSCIPADCGTKYLALTPENSKIIQMTANSSAFVGFRIDGTIKSINSIDFSLKTDTPESCDNQLKVDFFVDKNMEFSNNKSSMINCLIKSGYGCFDSTKDTKEYAISPLTPYCQRITLQESPTFEVGAWVKRVSGDINLTMWLHDEYGAPISEANCKLPQASFMGGEISCIISYLVKEPKNYFICLTPESELNGTYKIRGYSESEYLCGFHETPSHNTINSAAYQIFARGKKFGQIGTVEIKNVIGMEEKLSSRANDYLIKKYGSTPITCPLDGCIIPIELISQANQKVELSNLYLVYEELAGGVTNNTFFTINKSVAKVSTDGFQKFIIDDANFFTGSTDGKINYTITIGATQILNQEISIESIPVITGVNPSRTIFGYPTNFKIILNASRNISSYFLDFGDGNNITAQYNSMRHTYNQSGIYTITASATDSNNRSASRTFFISVETPENFINSVLNESQTNLEKIKTQISKYPEFYQKALNDAVQFISYENQLKDYQKEFSQTYGSEARLLELATKILNFSVPKSIELTKEAKGITFYPQAENINLAYLAEATGETVPANSQKYIDGILGWNQGTMDIKVDYTEFSVEKKGEVKHLVSIFSMTLRKLKVDKKDPRLIMNQMEGLDFSSKAIVDAKNPNYATAKLSDEITSILFSTTADVDFKTLPLFVSLPIDYIPVASDGTGATDPEEPRWLILILILILLIIIAVIVYIILQIWYKKKYEKYLFPNKTDLYNLLSFIETSRKNGMSEMEIKKKLSASGWSNEHITYAMKKHAGKRTGMVELPVGFVLDKIGKNKKKDDENTNNGQHPLMRPSRRPSIMPTGSNKMPRKNISGIKGKYPTKENRNP